MRRTLLGSLSVLVVGLVVGCGQYQPSSASLRQQSPAARQALADADDAANDGSAGCDEAADLIDDGVGAADDAMNLVDEALAAGRASLEEAAHLGACACDVDALQAAIDAGQTCLQPILDGCTQADAAAPGDVEAGACEDVAVELGEVADELTDLSDACEAYDVAFGDCDVAYEDADDAVSEASHAFADACSADVANCDGEAFNTRLNEIYAEADAACAAALEGADATLPDDDLSDGDENTGSIVIDGDVVDSDIVNDSDNSGDEGDYGDDLDLDAAACEQAYEDANAAVEALSSDLQDTCMSHPADCASASEALRTAMQEAFAQAQAVCDGVIQ